MSGHHSRRVQLSRRTLLPTTKVTIYIAVELSNPTCRLSVAAKSSIMFITIAPSYMTVSGN
jgi:hypothetical protein